MSRPKRYLQVLAVVIYLAWSPLAANACPACGPVNLTLSEEINGNEVAVIATMTLSSKPVKDGDSELTRAVFRVDHVLKGGKHLAMKKEKKKGVYAAIHLLYFGDKPQGTRFLLMGIDPNPDPPTLKWGAPLPLTKQGVKYILKLPKLPEEGPDRLAFFQKYLENEDSLLGRDAYDEFAKAPYLDFKALKSRMNRKQLLNWIADKKLPRSRKRLYLMLLSVCGEAEDVKMLTGMLTAKPDENEPRIGLESVLISYLMLAGVDGMKLIDEQFMAKKKAHFSDIYSAIQALRFIGQEQKIIPKKRILISFRYMLDRPEYADLVIPDLARWEDWSVMDRLVKLFKDSDQETAWVRVPVIQYLEVCPLPKAKKYIAELKKIDPDSYKRASFLLPLGPSRGKTKKPAPTPAPAPKSKQDGKSNPAVKKTTKPEAKTAVKTGKKGLRKTAPPPSEARANQKRHATTDYRRESFIAIAGIVGGFSLLMVGFRRARKKRPSP